MPKKRFIVAKFGGVSLGEPEKIRLASDRILEIASSGRFPVAVVSAPAAITDDLLLLAGKTVKNLPPRETAQLISFGEIVSAALLAGALGEKGRRAVSLTAVQAGIIGFGNYLNAGVKSVKTRLIKNFARRGVLPVIVGFQAVDEKGNVLTLGRGGSDLSAVALAKFLKAEKCVFFTDVKGIYTANPTLVPGAKKIPFMNYGELLRISGRGRPARQLSAIQYAQKNGVKLEIRSSFHDEAGTLVEKPRADQAVRPVCLSISGKKNAKVVVIGRNLKKGFSFPRAEFEARVKIPLKRVSVGDGRIELTANRESSRELLKSAHDFFFRR